jgi:hypothetical protein
MDRMGASRNARGWWCDQPVPEPPRRRISTNHRSRSYLSPGASSREERGARCPKSRSRPAVRHEQVARAERTSNLTTTDPAFDGLSSAPRTPQMVPTERFDYQAALATDRPPCECRESIRPAQATIRYSWTIPPSRLILRSVARSRSPWKAGVASGFIDHLPPEAATQSDGRN